MKKILYALVLAVFLLAAMPTNALASGLQEGRVVFGGSFTLERDEVLDGDLIVFGGNAELQVRSVVQGDVFVMGGNVESTGTIEGNVAVMGGNIRLLDGSVVTGDVTTFGGNVSRSPGAQVQGEVISGEGLEIPFSGDFGFFSESFEFGPRGPSPLRVVWSAASSVLWFIFRVLMMSALAVLVVMFWPAATTRTADAMVSEPLAAGGLGLLTLLAAPPLLLLLIITILLSPLSLIGIMLLVVAIVFGWIALGMEVGRRLARAFSWDMNEPALAGLGTLLLTFVLGGIGVIPCIGWIPGLFVASLGLGSVLLTRFGSQAYPAALPAGESKGSGKKKSASK